MANSAEAQKSELDKRLRVLGSEVKKYKQELTDYSNAISDVPGNYGKEKGKGALDRIKIIKEVVEKLLVTVEKIVKENQTILSNEEIEKIDSDIKDERSLFKSLLEEINDKFSKLPELIRIKAMLQDMKNMAGFVKAAADSVSNPVQETEIQKMIDGIDVSLAEREIIEEYIKSELVSRKTALEYVNKITQDFARLKSKISAEETLTKVQVDIINGLDREIEEHRSFVAEKTESFRTWIEARDSIKDTTKKLQKKTDEMAKYIKELNAEPLAANIGKAEAIHKDINEELEKLKALRDEDSTSQRLTEPDRNDLVRTISLYQRELIKFNAGIEVAREKNKKNQALKAEIKENFDRLKWMTFVYNKSVDDLSKIDIKKEREGIAGLKEKFDNSIQKFTKLVNEMGGLSSAEKEKLIREAAPPAARALISKQLSSLNEKFNQYEKNYDTQLVFPANAGGVINNSRWDAAIDDVNTNRKENRKPLEKSTVSWKAWFLGGDTTQIIKGEDGKPLMEVTVKSPTGWVFRGADVISSVKLLSINDESLALIGAMAGRLEQGSRSVQPFLASNHPKLIEKARQLGEEYYREPAQSPSHINAAADISPVPIPVSPAVDDKPVEQVKPQEVDKVVKEKAKEDEVQIKPALYLPSNSRVNQFSKDQLAKESGNYVPEGQVEGQQRPDGKPHKHK